MGGGGNGPGKRSWGLQPGRGITTLEGDISGKGYLTPGGKMYRLSRKRLVGVGFIGKEGGGKASGGD